MLAIDLAGKRALIAGVSDDGGFGFAIARAPCESVTVTMAGSSSGESPTASATAKSSDSTGGRPSSWFTARTKSTTSTMTCSRK